jgi:hypothetical protein
MRSLFKHLAVLALLSVLGAFAPTALAAAPSNDTFASAKLVTLGFSEAIDTTEATTDSDDAQLLETCPAPASDASVWYALDGTGTSVAIDVFNSSYTAGVIVATGSPGALETVICGPDKVVFFAEAGIRYYVLAIDDQEDGGGNGGTLRIAFNQSQAPRYDFTVDSYGRVDGRSGVATISGSYTCTAGASFSTYVEASQSRGRSSIFGSGSFSGTCDGTLQRWSADITPEGGKFVGGKTMTQTFTAACSAGGDECIGRLVEQTVKLRGGR